MSLEPGYRLGPYEISAPIGAGGMGEVYKAKDTRLDRSVAVKVLPAHLSSDPDLRARFEREARVVSSLNHPHICTLHDIGRQDGVDFLVMEYLEGESLFDRLAKGALPLDQALRFGIQIADALDRAHRAGVVHRDLKPGNVVLTKSGAKLLDFGLAKALAPASAPAHSALATEAAKPLTERGIVLGTVQYMAPEQLEGKEADSRSDIFAFGAVLYEMVTGRRAFTGSSQASLIGAILRDEPAPIAGLQPMTPPALERVVRTCLAKDPDERWQSAHDLGRELRWIAEGRSSPGVEVRPATPRSRLSPRLVSAAIALAALGLGAALGRLAHRAPANDAPSTRFVVPPPSQGRVEDAPALSPDGRSLVYALAGEDGTTALYLHSFGNGEARKLPGTEGGQDAFFSPDGASIAFSGRGQLKRLNLESGTLQTICAATDTRGGAWSPDGRILFTPNSSAPLFLVSASGGQPKPVTTLAPGDQSHRFPLFLPDGRHILYVSLGGEELVGILWSELGSGSARRVLPDLSRPVYDARGYLLFVRQGTLLYQRFDAARGELSGEPAPVADHVGTDEGIGAKAWITGGGGALAWRSGSARKNQLVWYDKSGKELGEVTSAGDFKEPSLSPDGSRVAITKFDEGDYSSMWLYDVRSKDRSTRLTFAPERAATPAWMPDGTSLVYRSQRGGTFAIARRPASGTGAEEILQTTDQRTWPDAVSSDGRYVALESGTAAGFDITLLPLAGDRKPIPFATSPANETHSIFSPDGRFLAYTSDETGRPEISVQPVPPDGSKWQVSTDGGDMASWSRDGEELYYLNAARRFVAVPIVGRSPFSVGEPRTLFAARVQAVAATGDRTMLLPAPDGKRFLLLSAMGAEREPWIRVALGWKPR